MINIEDIMKKLRVGALEDITTDELQALIEHIDYLEDIAFMYESLCD